MDYNFIEIKRKEDTVTVNKNSIALVETHNMIHSKITLSVLDENQNQVIIYSTESYNSVINSIHVC